MKDILKDILVVGGAGFIGSHFVEECIAHGHRVFVLDNLSTGKETYVPDGTKVWQKDIRYKDMLMFLIYQHFDYVVNFAVLPLMMSFTHPQAIHDVNCLGVINLLDLVMQHNRKYNANTTFVQISTSEVFGTLEYMPMDEKHPMNPSTYYGASKAAAEMYVKSYAICYNVPTKIIRPFNTFGPRMRTDNYCNVIYKWIQAALDGKALQVNSPGTQTRDFSYVEDIARGIYLAMEELPLGETVNIGSGTETSILDLAKLVNQVTDTPFLNFAPSRDGEVMRHCCDVSKITALGWAPRVSLRDGIIKTYQWIKENRDD